MPNDLDMHIMIYMTLINSGDSGSALVVRSGVQVGIASAQHGQMVTYTHVPHYYHWIRDTVMALSCQKSST